MEEILKSAETTDNVVDETTNVGTGDVADTSEQINDFEFSEGEQEGEEIKEDEAKQSSEEQKPSSENQENKKPKKTNSDYARERRERERKAELERVREETRVNAIIDALGGVNPYTGEKMVDKADVDEYLTMKEIEKHGKDPISDFSSWQKQKAKEQAEAERRRRESEEWINNDIKEFKSKHPDVDFDALLKDDLFVSIAKPQAGKVPMTQIYELYTVALKKIEEKTVARAAQAIANQQSTVGAFKTTPPTSVKTVEQMTREERDRLVERALRGEKITFN